MLFFLFLVVKQDQFKDPYPLGAPQQTHTQRRTMQWSLTAHRDGSRFGFLFYFFYLKTKVKRRTLSKEKAGMEFLETANPVCVILAQSRFIRTHSGKTVLCTKALQQHKNNFAASILLPLQDKQQRVCPCCGDSIPTGGWHPSTPRPPTSSKPRNMHRWKCSRAIHSSHSQAPQTLGTQEQPLKTIPEYIQCIDEFPGLKYISGSVPARTCCCCSVDPPICYH